MGWSSWNHFRIHIDEVITMWCMMNSPLLAGNDLRSMTPATVAILTHPEIIALNQDPLAYQARRLRDDGDSELCHRAVPRSGGFAHQRQARGKFPVRHGERNALKTVASHAWRTAIPAVLRPVFPAWALCRKCPPRQSRAPHPATRRARMENKCQNPALRNILQ